MKRWFRLTLVCCVLLCLFLSLPQSVGLNHGLQGKRFFADRLAGLEEHARPGRPRTFPPRTRRTN
jgi:hypothetical protein